MGEPRHSSGNVGLAMSTSPATNVPLSIRATFQEMDRLRLRAVEVRLTLMAALRAAAAQSETEGDRLTGCSAAGLTVVQNKARRFIQRGHQITDETCSGLVKVVLRVVNGLRPASPVKHLSKKLPAVERWEDALGRVGLGQTSDRPLPSDLHDTLNELGEIRNVLLHRGASAGLIGEGMGYHVESRRSQQWGFGGGRP